LECGLGVDDSGVGGEGGSGGVGVGGVKKKKRKKNIVFTISPSSCD